jgi:hypothetical protein
MKEPKMKVEYLSPPEMNVDRLVAFKDSLENSEAKSLVERVIAIYLERRANPIRVEYPET